MSKRGPGPVTIKVTQDSAMGEAADAMATRLWYAVAQPGEEVELIVLITGVVLYLARTADMYAPGDANEWLDEVHKQAKSVLAQLRTQRTPQ
jgi:hypothetical protein